jgi:hypothetical protein
MTVSDQLKILSFSRSILNNSGGMLEELISSLLPAWADTVALSNKNLRKGNSLKIFL